MQKKVLWSGLIALLLIIIIVVFSLLNQNKEKQIVLPCNPYADLNSVPVGGQIKSCDCLKDISEREQCRTGISDGALYNKAMVEINPDICEGITSLSMRQACISNSKAKAAFARKPLKIDLTATTSQIK